LVMELVEGETIADHVSKGPMPADEVLKFGIQIAEALDAAHRQNIVHRDLKPGNIMLTKSGVKLLDFGLAKSAFTAAAPTAGTAFATAAKPLTQEGTIIGTFQYMAPEQLEGAEADPRTDIFAFGAVLYEMATGRRAFEGKTRTSLIAAIVSSQPPPISKVQPLTPPALEHVIERCLEKEPDARWQTARDIAEELKWISAKGSQIGVAAPVAARRRTRERLSWSLYPVIAILGALAAWGWIWLRTAPQRVIEATILPPGKAQFAFDSSGPPALSPDGSRLALVAQLDSVRQLWVRPLSGGTAQPLAGTEGASYPFWSPDSRMIAFFADGKLKKIDASGGPAQTLCDAPVGRGGSWSRDGLILFAPRSTDGLFSVPDAGGVATQVTHVDNRQGETDHRLPFFLADGRRFLYLIEGSGGGGTDAIHAGSLDGKLKQKIVVASSNMAVSPAGHLVYWRDRVLVAQKFDERSLILGPDVVPIAQNVMHTGRNDAAFSLSSVGDLVYETGEGTTISQPAWFDAGGKQLEVVGKPLDVTGPAVSHDGRRVAASVTDPQKNHSDVWVDDLTRGTATRLTFGEKDEFVPLWSPDDTKIVYTGNQKSPGDIYVKRASGTGDDELVYATSLFKVTNDWSPDGKTLLFQELASSGTGWDLWTWSFADHKAQVFLRTPFTEALGRFSPDGHWVAYQSNESGKNQVYVVPFSGSAGKWQISTEGGYHVRWSRDGKQLFYLTPDYKLVAVDVSARGEEFVAGIPRVLFQTNIRRTPGPQWDVSPDGKRFLINTVVQQTEAAPLTLVHNWETALKK
nr:protein kinase [Acidobacteriota bacterium]